MTTETERILRTHRLSVVLIDLGRQLRRPESLDDGTLEAVLDLLQEELDRGRDLLPPEQPVVLSDPDLDPLPF